MYGGKKYEIEFQAFHFLKLQEQEDSGYKHAFFFHESIFMRISELTAEAQILKVTR